MTAIDDFGAGCVGLGLLADFQPDLLKIDIALVRGTDTDPVRVSIVRGIVQSADALGCTLLAEGVETAAEYRALRALGVPLYQGYQFGRPALEALPRVTPVMWASFDEPSCSEP